MDAAFKRTKFYQTLKHWRYLVGDAEYRLRDLKPRADFHQFCHRDGGLGFRENLLPKKRKPKTALIVRNITLPYAKVEALVMKAFQMAGFETVAFGRRGFDFLRYDWLAGNKTGFDLHDFGTEGDAEWVDDQSARLRSLREWLALEYQGVRVGRFVIASTLRSLKVGQLDFANSYIQARLREILESSVLHTRAAVRLLQAVKPDCALFMDRGYCGTGEICDQAISQGIDTLTWNLGYKSNRLVFKRYNLGNRADHPLALSAESWRRLCSMPWKSEYGHQIRQELFQCYQAQDWMGFVGTQFDKKILSQDMTRNTLGLSSDRKVALIFPHILWDGSFFFGEDLFDDYTEWLVETIRAAVANPRLQWVVKLHPAHVVKTKQGNHPEKPAELKVIEQVFGTLPAHLKLVYPDTEISTYSLLEIADYTITVRGTVGIEAALFGIPVVTAGTGRYAGRGFTLDSSTRQEYLHKLATLARYSRLSAEQVKLAERFAYGTLFCRPLNLSSASLEYERDGLATPRLTVKCQTRQEWLRAPDMRQLAAWFADGKTEDMLVLPSEIGAVDGVEHG